MDNLKSPAYPQPFNDKQLGFTKLEKAALMIAQGLCASLKMGTSPLPTLLAETAVMVAKAVLEEANK